ncbi:hypothetical protein [Providencia manganoxydans]|uniref:hypothetical protein n=1 Tax=Providencia manganoxydans TaxID=2923283 RepID=UPI0034DD7AF3
MPKQQTVTLNFKTSDGKVLPASFVVTDGASTFELWKKQPGNEEKTEQQFLAEQKGIQGAKGETGAQGPKGDAGAKGETGAQGPKGDAGAKGEAGAQGPKGDAGAKGETGAQGPKGDAGAKGEAGAQGASIVSVEVQVKENP